MLLDEIQEQEYISIYIVMYSSSGATDENRQLSADDNHVYVGNFDGDGLNVNNNWDDNRNDNLGVSSARLSCLYRVNALLSSGAFYFSFLLALSILQAFYLSHQLCFENLRTF